MIILSQGYRREEMLQLFVSCGLCSLLTTVAYLREVEPSLLNGTSSDQFPNISYQTPNQMPVAALSTALACAILFPFEPRE